MKGRGAGRASGGRGAAAGARPTAGAPRAAPAPAGPLPLGHPAVLVAAAIAAACILFTVTYRIIDSDFWQHLLVGRVMWQQHAIPREHLWSWVSYGRPEVLLSWLFCGLVWPFYAAGGITGLFVWRWLTTLAVFAFLWATARQLGARGLVPLVVLVWCALIYRGRSQVRPETLAAVLIAVELWILETRRQRIRAGHPGGRRIAWLVPLVWVWVNAHVSYFIAFVLLGIHALDLAVARRRGGADVRPLARLRPIAIVGAAMLAICFLNPFGWRSLWLPFDYALHLSKEPLFRGIGELQPMSWGANARNGVWLMIVGWPLLLLWRARRHTLDVAETLTCALATAYAIPSQRFVGVYAIVAAPYVARDLEEWVRSRRWPEWTGRPGARAALAGLASVLIGVPEALRPSLTPGVGVALDHFPVAACDFMAKHGVRGHGFAHFRYLGYQAWRFWPDRERLPFMDIHQAGTPEDRLMFAEAFSHPDTTWPRLVERYQLDYVMLDRQLPSGIDLLDRVDADSSWTLVFVDDATALFVRRAGPMAAVADSFGYRWLAGGDRKAGALGARLAESVVRANLRRELERALTESPHVGTIYTRLANLDMLEGHPGEARTNLERARAAAPRTPGVHQGFGIIALLEHRPRDAIAEFERELRLSGAHPGIHLGLGIAWEQLGDPTRARLHYQRELAIDPGNVEARRRLGQLGGGAP